MTLKNVPSRNSLRFILSFSFACRRGYCVNVILSLHESIVEILLHVITLYTSMLDSQYYFYKSQHIYLPTLVFCTVYMRTISLILQDLAFFCRNNFDPLHISASSGEATLSEVNSEPILANYFTQVLCKTIIVTPFWLLLVCSLLGKWF